MKRDLAHIQKSVSEGAIVQDNFWEIPKAQWGDGPWLDEPDNHEFVQQGFQCILKRNHSGAWCGYVLLPPDHPWYGIDTESLTVDCYGGVTWAEKDLPASNKYTDIRADHWVIGFDCTHAFDYAPHHEAVLNQIIPSRSFRPQLPSARYRDLNFATEETIKIANQAASSWNNRK